MGKINFDNFLKLWFQALISDKQFYSEFIFADDFKLHAARKGIISRYCNRLNSLNVVPENSEEIKYLKQEINYIKNHPYNTIAKQDYQTTPFHFARMMYVGLDIIQGKKMQDYLDFFKDYLDDTNKFEAMLLKLKFGIPEKRETYHKINFLNSYKDFSSVKDETAYDWRKRIRKKYQRILLSHIVGKDVKSTTKYQNEWTEIKIDIAVIKNKIIKNLNSI